MTTEPDTDEPDADDLKITIHVLIDRIIPRHMQAIADLTKRQQQLQEELATVEQQLSNQKNNLAFQQKELETAQFILLYKQHN
jgi:predicted  nucleic acid-binding Zn-ribbon protein